jgi:putative lipoic acid-binding regulatory protein
VHAIVLRHAPDTDAGRLAERLSANGNFLALSYRLNATSREQLEALVAELKACEGVLMLL